ncbi:hypothetical protein BDZ97DRAFT_1752484 [Flammula alnicola]|nr:hypothetical protein BDZ97DRAFT_1752484 [Flammula alnicola]
MAHDCDVAEEEEREEDGRGPQGHIGHQMPGLGAVTSPHPMGAQFPTIPLMTAPKCSQLQTSTPQELPPHLPHLTANLKHDADLTRAREGEDHGQPVRSTSVSTTPHHHSSPLTHDSHDGPTAATTSPDNYALRDRVAESILNEIHPESSWSPAGVHMESRWTPGGLRVDSGWIKYKYTSLSIVRQTPGGLQVDSTETTWSPWSPPGIRGGG